MIFFFQRVLFICILIYKTVLNTKLIINDYLLDLLLEFIIYYVLYCVVERKSAAKSGQEEFCKYICIIIIHKSSTIIYRITHKG